MYRLFESPAGTVYYWPTRIENRESTGCCASLAAWARSDDLGEICDVHNLGSGQYVGMTADM